MPSLVATALPNLPPPAVCGRYTEEIRWDIDEVERWLARQWRLSNVPKLTLRESLLWDVSRSWQIGTGPTSCQDSDVETLRSDAETKLSHVARKGDDKSWAPHNWPVWRRMSVMVLVVLMTLLSVLAYSMFPSPVTDSIAREFELVNKPLRTFIITIYLLGFASGSVIVAPLSERFGRLPLYHISNIMFVGCAAGCAKSSNSAMLATFRFLLGFAGSTPAIIGGPTIADLIPIEKRRGFMILWALCPLLGLIIGQLGPFSGEALCEHRGWRWIFVVLALSSTSVTSLGFVILKETYWPVLLEREHARSPGKPTEDRHLDLQRSPEANSDLYELLYRPFRILISSPFVLLVFLHTAIKYSFIYIIFTTLPTVLKDNYKLPNETVGLSFIGLAVGMIIGLLICTLGLQYCDPAVPETLLSIMLPGAFFSPIGLFLYGWSVSLHAPWIVPIVGTAILGAGFFTSFVPVIVFLIDVFTTQAASAVAASAIFWSCVGALIPTAASPFFDALGVARASSILGSVSLIIMPLPFVFVRYGKIWRDSLVVRS